MFGCSRFRSVFDAVYATGNRQVFTPTQGSSTPKYPNKFLVDIDAREHDKLRTNSRRYRALDAVSSQRIVTRCHTFTNSHLPLMAHVYSTPAYVGNCALRPLASTSLVSLMTNLKNICRWPFVAPYPHPVHPSLRPPSATPVLGYPHAWGHVTVISGPPDILDRSTRYLPGRSVRWGYETKAILIVNVAVTQESPTKLFATNKLRPAGHGL